jgi:hypothetical protein
MYIVDDQNLISSNFEQIEFNIEIFSHESHRLSMKDFLNLSLVKRNEIVLINFEDYLLIKKEKENLKALMNTFLGVYFFYDIKKNNLEELIRLEIDVLSKVLGVHALPLAPLANGILLNQIKFFENLISDQAILQNHMVRFSQELDEMLTQVSADYSSAKKLHQAFRPQRVQEFKGAKLTSHFSSGDGVGIEFFDVISDEKKFFVVLIHTESYLISSSVMGILGAQKQISFNPLSFLQEAKHDVELINQTKKKKAKCEIFILEIDTKNFEVKRYGESSVNILRGVEVFQKMENHSNLILSKGEKMLILSSGYMNNFENIFPKIDIVSVINENNKSIDMDLMSFLFYKLKFSQKEDILKKDSTVLLLEVNRHGIHQI